MSTRAMHNVRKPRWPLAALVLLLAAPMAGIAQQPAPARSSVTSGRPVIEIPTMTHDFGEIYRQDKYVHAFTVRNKGGVPLLIEDVRPG